MDVTVTTDFVGKIQTLLPYWIRVRVARWRRATRSASAALDAGEN